MALALTKFQAYGVEAQEPVFKRHIQYAILTMTGANTDVTYDLGTFAGTFWTAVSGTDPGLSALTFFKDIAVRGEALLASQSSQFETRNKVGDGVLTFLSNSAGGGNATEPYVVTGLKSTDTVLAVTPAVVTANAAYVRSWQSLIDDGISVTYNTDPGASGKVTVAVRRSGILAVVAGEYNISISNLSPIITFASADAPTAWELIVSWILKPGQEPIGFVADVNGPKAS